MAATRCARALAAIVVVIALLPAGAAAAAPSPRDGGEIFGRPTRSTAPTSPAIAAALPTGFADNVVFGQLTQPTAIAFAPGGKIWLFQCFRGSSVAGYVCVWWAW